MNIPITEIITILGILFLWHILWKNYALDKLREELFHIRNELFDLTGQHKKFNFDDSIYKTFETAINGVIRYGHRLSIMNSIIFNILNQAQYPNSIIKSRLQIAYESLEKETIDEQLRKDITLLKKKFEQEIIKYLLKTSLTLMLISSVIFIYSLLSIVFSRARQSAFIKAAEGVQQKFTHAVNTMEFQAESSLLAA